MTPVTNFGVIKSGHLQGVAAYKFSLSQVKFYFTHTNLFTDVFKTARDGWMEMTI